ncbi:alpha/beta-hydrolase [Athelia psychrophila]|uniref:Alpha/beta-hydrolase n=1 Tax=Athelia psychrophila TaxID=1759441 RepID=A0A166RYE0_9AGAM|nr:alpha/beta-hydrolase [Fibularhizoctonia sp. CBS 109695]
MITESLPWPLYSLFHVDDGPLTIDKPSGSRNRSGSVSGLLRHYETPGVPPPFARIDSGMKRRESVPIRLWDIWRYGALAASKGVEVAGEVLSHGIWGPRKKSWGIEMTIITTLMRDVGQHSALVDIATVRMMMSLGGLVPLPSDALVTPVTFRVRKRNLRGILAKYDAREDGSRELSGEWVVGKRLWQRLQSEWKSRQKSDKPRPKQKERVVLYLHGGAYYLSSAAAQRLVSIPLTKYTGARVFALDYRLAPETTFPGPLHDAVCGYLRLVEDLGIPAENILLAGDSAGGGLTLALLMYLRDNAYPLPAGALLFSPWVDLTMSCDSWESNAKFDIVPFAPADDPMNPVGLYLGADMEYITHPYASPLFGDFRGLPPMLIQGGDAEVLRDEITLLAHKATLAGVDVQHELYEDCVHVFQAFPFLDAAARAFSSCRDFVRNVLPRVEARSPRAMDGLVQEKLEHEIDNENVRVVRGDGVETLSGKQVVEEEMQKEEEEKSDEEERPKKYSSWGRSRANSVIPHLAMSPKAERDTPAPLSESGQAADVRRIKSALSLLAASPTTRNHNRTASVQPSRPAYTRQFTGQMPMPSGRMSQTPTSPPSPSIRRRNASQSHPDIASLVAQWTNVGPANQTVMYKPRK